jgi:hypothetical protein
LGVTQKIRFRLELARRVVVMPIFNGGSLSSPGSRPGASIPSIEICIPAISDFVKTLAAPLAAFRPQRELRQMVWGMATARGGGLPPLFQLPDPLLEALHRESQRLVTKLVGVAETGQCRHSALVLIPGDLETMPDDIDDGAE